MTTNQTAADAIAEELRTYWSEAQDGVSFEDMAQTALDTLDAAGFAVVPASEIGMLRRGGRELGRMVKRLSDDHLAAIGEEPGGDLIDTDGDGHWDEVWDRLMALRPERDEARAEADRLRARLAAVHRLADKIQASVHDTMAPSWAADLIRAALDGEATSE